MQEKRMKRIFNIENQIKSGLVHHLESRNMELGSKMSPKSPRANTQPIGGYNSYMGSDSMIDLPLREPLDTELRLNRTLAKQIYNKEKNALVKQKKIEMKEKKDKDLKDFLNQQQKDEKKRQEQMQKLKDMPKPGLIAIKQKQMDAAAKAKQDRREFEIGQREKQRELIA